MPAELPLEQTADSVGNIAETVQGLRNVGGNKWRRVGIRKDDDRSIDQAEARLVLRQTQHRLGKRQVPSELGLQQAVQAVHD